MDDKEQFKKLEEEYNKLTEKEKEELHKLYSDPDLLEQEKAKLEKIIFRFTPPTPEDILDPSKGWIPPAYIEGLYDYVKEDFIKAMKTTDPYATIVSYGSTRTGKSILSILFLFYSIVYVSYLRDPHKYYNVSKISRLTAYLVSFKKEKTKEVILDPLLKLLDASDKFYRTHYEKAVYKNTYSEELEEHFHNGLSDSGIIKFSEAGKFGDITFCNIVIVTGSDPSALIGSNICFSAISEINWFVTYTAATDEDIKQLFTDLRDRIHGTIGINTFPCWVYLDSSSNNAESPLEEMILNEVQYEDNCFYRHYIRWEVRPHMFPIWQKTGETFQVITGDGNIPARIVKNEQDLKDVPKNLIIDVPVDVKKIFEKNLLKSIKDIAGRPTSKANKFIQVSSIIDRIFDNDKLKNIEGVITADKSQKPENLIWRMVRDGYFYQYDGKRWMINRAATEPRFIGIDIAFAKAGDLLGFAMGHLEYSIKLNKDIIVTDFAFPIGPGENGINIDSVKHFIYDLGYEGNVLINKIGADTFQFESALQWLERANFETGKYSTVRTTDLYELVLNMLFNNEIRSGKNIFFKNNLISLERRDEKGKQKIDHTNGQRINNYDGDWINSRSGINAKDVSDAFAVMTWLAVESGYKATVIYEEENQKFSENLDDQEDVLKNAYEILHGLKRKNTFSKTA